MSKAIVTREEITKRIQSIVGMFCVRLPPLELCEDDPEGGNTDLQDWIGCHQTKESYSTNISIMDAAWNIALSQIENGYEELSKDE